MDKRILESIESCRPGSQDLESIELADVAARVEQDANVRAVYERVQRADKALRRAMEQVAVPTGLAERILAQLKAAEEPVTVAPRADVPERRDRREWLRAGLVATVAASVLAAVFWGWLQGGSEDSLESLAEAWGQQLEERGETAWQPNAKSPRGFAPPEAITPLPEGWEMAGWQWIDREKTAVAYRIADGQGGKALLYVTRLQDAESPMAPLASPQLRTGGKAIGYWRTGRLTYVLVVPERNYRMFVRSAGGPIA